MNENEKPSVVAQSLFLNLYKNSMEASSMPIMPKLPQIKIISRQIRSRNYALGGLHISFDEHGVGYADAVYREYIEKDMQYMPGVFTIEEVKEEAPPLLDDAVKVDLERATKIEALEAMFGPKADLAANFTLLLAKSGYYSIEEANLAYRKMVGEDIVEEGTVEQVTIQTEDLSDTKDELNFITRFQREEEKKKVQLKEQKIREKKSKKKIE